MSVYLSTYRCNAALVKEENPLPLFRDRKKNFEVVNSKNVPEEYSKLLGYECGKRILPYKNQDRYERNCIPTKLKSVVLENEHLKAIFLPELGARLISLYDKDDKRELLFKNENIQMCNLAIRDAWFSGGIEFNIGQYGHSLTTSDDVYMSKQIDTEGNEFIRIYEFEKMHEIYWQIDFHLPKKSKFLFLKAKIYNTKNEDTSLYCWTNTALIKTDYTRVFSNTKNALFLNPFLKDNKKGYDYITLPTVEKLEDLDISYPKRFPYSNEYFFTSNNSKIPYEATFEKNGEGFLDFSTQNLGYRKMFCWGEQQGGKHWESYLSPTTTGEYFEAQAGVAPSQLHGAILEKNKSYSFTQVFTSINLEKEKIHNEDYNKSFDYVKENVERQIGDLDIYDLDKKFDEFLNIPTGEVLHKGSSFGYLNKAYLETEIPKPLKFIKGDNFKENIFNELLDQEIKSFDYINQDFDYPPFSYLNKMNLENDFVKYLKACEKLESFEDDLALELFLELDKLNSNCLISRNIAYIYKLKNNKNECYKYYEKALVLSNSKYYLFILEEYINVLIDNNDIKRAKEIIEKIERKYLDKSDYLLLDLATISAKVGDLENLEKALFCRQYATIREGENPFPYLYFEYLALKEAKYRGVEVDDSIREFVKTNNKIPFELDFTVLLEQ